MSVLKVIAFILSALWRCITERDQGKEGIKSKLCFAFLSSVASHSLLHYETLLLSHKRLIAQNDSNWSGISEREVVFCVDLRNDSRT